MSDEKAPEIVILAAEVMSPKYHNLVFFGRTNFSLIRIKHSFKIPLKGECLWSIWSQLDQALFYLLALQLKAIVQTLSSKCVEGCGIIISCIHSAICVVHVVYHLLYHVSL